MKYKERVSRFRWAKGRTCVPYTLETIDGLDGPHFYTLYLLDGPHFCTLYIHPIAIEGIGYTQMGLRPHLYHWICVLGTLPAAQLERPTKSGLRSDVAFLPLKPKPVAVLCELIGEPIK